MCTFRRASILGSMQNSAYKMRKVFCRRQGICAVEAMGPNAQMCGFSLEIRVPRAFSTGSSDAWIFASSPVDSAATQHDNARHRTLCVTGFLSDQTKAYGRLP